MGLWQWVREQLWPRKRVKVTDRFGIDNLSQGVVAIVAEIGAKASGKNGISWNLAQPTIVGPYADPDTLLAEFAAARAAGHKIQFNFRPDNEWAIVTDPAIPPETYLDPGTGLAHDKWHHLNALYHAAWQDVITYVVTTFLEDGDAIQIGSEPDYQWVAPEGFAEMVQLAYSAAKAANPNVTVLAAGFTMADNYLLVDAAFRAKVALLPPGQQAQFATYEARSLDQLQWVADFIEQTAGYLDVLTWHYNYRIDTAPPVMAWLRARLKEAGTPNLPVWCDDALSGPLYRQFFDTTADLALQTLVQNGNAAGIATYRVRQASTVAKRACTAFGAGVSRIFLTWDIDLPGYWLPVWANNGFLTSGQSGFRKAAFYSLQELVSAIDGFQTCEQVGTTSYRFSFSDKPACIVAWSDTGTAELDLSGVTL